MEGSAQINQFDGRDVYYSILVLCGPRFAVSAELDAELRQTFSKVIVFIIPDDYGEFPDTSGYTRKDFAKMKLENEDSGLYKYMTKCVDAVNEYNDKKMKHLDNLGFREIDASFSCPNFGDKAFAATGIVKAIPLGQNYTKMAVPMAGSMN